jgi:hypothetical protein
VVVVLQTAHPESRCPSRPPAVDDGTRGQPEPRSRRRLPPAHIYRPYGLSLVQVVPGVRHSPAVTHNLACAVEGSANHLVSADRHLLDPAEYEGIQTVTPRDFVDILSLS